MKMQYNTKGKTTGRFSCYNNPLSVCKLIENLWTCGSNLGMGSSKSRNYPAKIKKRI